MTTMSEHWLTIKKTSDEIVEWYIQLLAASHTSLQLTTQQKAIIFQCYDQAWQRYIEASHIAYRCSQRVAVDKRRSPYFNQLAKDAYQKIRDSYTDRGFVSILGGVTIVRQIGSLKYIFIHDNKSQPVIDVSSSAATLNVGAGFPLFVAVDIIDAMLGINENCALVYHASVYQRVCCDYLKSLYPNQFVEPKIFIESSGTAVNSVSIEAATAYAEKIGCDMGSRLLAFQGTWSGGFGTAKEASGFGVSDQIVKRTGLRWVDRCLPIPHSEKEEHDVLGIIEQKVASGDACGLLFEKIIGDAGIIELSDTFVSNIVDIMKHSPHGALPIIVDDIQAGGARSSCDYWSFEQQTNLSTYEQLVVTAGKGGGGGKPFACTLIPRSITTAAYPLSMLTTHSGNGPLGRAVTYAKFILHPTIQTVKTKNAETIARELSRQPAVQYRGRHLNIGIVTRDAQELELLQNYLFIKYGIIASSFPSTLRFQPNMIESPETLARIIATIRRALVEIRDEHPDALLSDIAHAISGQRGGLNV